jgi:hypothetical protein
MVTARLPGLAPDCAGGRVEIEEGSSSVGMVEIAVGTMRVRASEGAENQARRIAAMVGRARDWAGPILGMTPSLGLHVAGPADWVSVAAEPRLAYGLPHTSDEGDRLVVGVEPAGFFGETARSYATHADGRTRQALLSAFGDGLDLGRFVDAIVVHELGHLYHQQVPFEFPRLWLASIKTLRRPQTHPPTGGTRSRLRSEEERHCGDYGADAPGGVRPYALGSMSCGSTQAGFGRSRILAAGVHSRPVSSLSAP